MHICYLTIDKCFAYIYISGKSRITGKSFISIVILALVLVKGLLACVSKDANDFMFSKYHQSRFWRYNRPTTEDMKEFWLNATIYFSVIPFYIPIIFFSTSVVDLLWCLFLLCFPQFTFIGIEISKALRKAKEAKLKQNKQQQERIEQERREELGKWK